MTISSMVTEQDIHTAAWMTVRQYGDLAPLRAANRIRDLRAAGDMRGVDTWKRIADYVAEILE